MPDILDIENFLIKARIQTYTTNGGKTTPLLDGSYQLEFNNADWLYRDIYFMGKNVFNGIETIYFQGKPVFSNSYYGNWGDMSEDQIDLILRGALRVNPETRLNKKVEWQKDGYIYTCEPRFTDDIERVQGTEMITKDGEQIFDFIYAGGILD